jgi:hypothetical protein
VVGRLAVEHAVADEVPERALLRRVRRMAEVLVRAHVQVGPAQPAVAQQRVHVGVAGDQPLPGRLEPRDRFVLAQRGVHLVRVRHERGAPRVESVRHTAR